MGPHLGILARNSCDSNQPTAESYKACHNLQVCTIYASWQLCPCPYSTRLMEGRPHVAPQAFRLRCAECDQVIAKGTPVVVVQFGRPKHPTAAGVPEPRPMSAFAQVLSLQPHWADEVLPDANFVTQDMYHTVELMIQHAGGTDKRNSLLFHCVLLHCNYDGLLTKCLAHYMWRLFATLPRDVLRFITEVNTVPCGQCHPKRNCLLTGLIPLVSYVSLHSVEGRAALWKAYHDNMQLLVHRLMCHGQWPPATPIWPVAPATMLTACINKRLEILSTEEEKDHASSKSMPPRKRRLLLKKRRITLDDSDSSDDEAKEPNPLPRQLPKPQLVWRTCPMCHQRPYMITHMPHCGHPTRCMNCMADGLRCPLCFLG